MHTDYCDIMANNLAPAIITISYFNHLFKGGNEDLLTFPDRCVLYLLTGTKGFH